MKRINVRLLAILTASVLILSVGAVALYHFQMSRSTKTFLQQAQAYKEQGDLENARKNLRQYLDYRPEDKERLVLLGLWTKEWFDELITSGVSIEHKFFFETFAFIEAGLREDPKSIELRDAAIDLARLAGRTNDRITHLKSRIECAKELGENYSKYALQLAHCYAQSGEDDQCLAELAKLIGFDPEKAALGEPAFDVASATQPDEVNAYLLTAEILIARRRQSELADQVIQQMVDVNPNSAMAYVGRAHYLRKQKSTMNGAIAAAANDINKAMSLMSSSEQNEEISPILREAVAVYSTAGDFKKAREQLDRFLELNPDSPESYLMLSRWARLQNNLTQAREFLHQGLERRPQNRALLESLVSLELDSRSRQEAESALASLRQLSLPPALLSYYESQLEVITGNYVKAARKLEEIAPQIAQLRPSLIPKLDRSLAIAYSQLGQHDRALQRYKNLVDSTPGDLRSLWGVILSYRELGQVGDAINAYVKLTNQLVKDNKLPPNYPFLVQHLEMEMVRQQQRPEPQRDWGLAETLVREIKASPILDDGQKYTILASYFQQTGDAQRADEVHRYLSQKDPNNVALKIADISNLAKSDVDAAIAKLDELERTSANKVVATKLLRLELLGKQKPADLREQLIAIEQEAAEFPPRQRATLYKALGAGYMELQETDEVARLYRRAVEESPEDVEMRMQILKLALHRGDEGGIHSAIREIEEVFGSNSPEQNCAQASYLIWRYKNGLDDDSVLDEANTLVQNGLTKREGWAELRHLSADINNLRGDSVAAINEMEKALRSGKTRVTDVLQLANLLYRSNRLAEAKQRFESIDASHMSSSDRLAYMEVLSKLGQLPKDVEFDRESGNALYLLNVGRILVNDADQLARLKNQPTEVTDVIPQRLSTAAECFRKTVELEPTLEEGWKQLIRTLVKLNKKDEAFDAIRDAQLEITEERSQLFLAQVNEYVGKFGEAYTFYKSCLKTDPENVEALAGLVNLLTRIPANKENFAARQKEAATYIERIINLKHDPTDRGRTLAQMTARRVKAQSLVTSNTYHDFVEALSLLEQNQVEGEPMAAEDLLLFAMFSVSRNDGVSRDRAISKLESIRDDGERRLTNQELLVLAELYKKQDRWQDCSSVMNNLLSKYPNDMALLGPWLTWLIEDDQLKLAERWLENANPRSLAAVRARAHILVKKGETKTALKLLSSYVPREIRNAEQENIVVAIAKAMELMAKDDPQIYPYVEKVWRLYVRQFPRQSLALAQYLGNRGNPDQIAEAFAICESHVNAGRLQQTLAVALGILRVNQARIPVGSEYHAQVEGWFDQAQREHPDTPALVIQRSEFEGLIGNFDAVETSLRRYIEHEAITPQQKATAYNNLAYVLALQGKGRESMPLVEEAVQILGPISDLRDTRAMVYLALNKPHEALEDLNDAIAHGGETPFKLFHKALVELETGDRLNATESMQKALELGLEVNQLNLLEKRQFERLISQLSIETTKPVSTAGS